MLGLGGSHLPGTCAASGPDRCCGLGLALYPGLGPHPGAATWAGRPASLLPASLASGTKDTPGQLIRVTLRSAVAGLLAFPCLPLVHVPSLLLPSCFLLPASCPLRLTPCFCPVSPPVPSAHWTSFPCCCSHRPLPPPPPPLILVLLAPSTGLTSLLPASSASLSFSGLHQQPLPLPGWLPPQKPPVSGSREGETRWPQWPGEAAPEPGFWSHCYTRTPLQVGRGGAAVGTAGTHPEQQSS